MANLNFQQPPRSIANSSINNRGGGGVGGVTGNSFGSGAASSLSGHVTPTSGMFPQSSASFAPQSQLSPNRNASVQLTGGIGGPTIGSGSVSAASQAARANIFGQRAFADRRQMQGLGPMVNAIGSSLLLLLRKN